MQRLPNMWYCAFCHRLKIMDPVCLVQRYSVTCAGRRLLLLIDWEKDADQALLLDCKRKGQVIYLFLLSGRQNCTFQDLLEKIVSHLADKSAVMYIFIALHLIICLVFSFKKHSLLIQGKAGSCNSSTMLRHIVSIFKAQLIDQNGQYFMYDDVNISM